MNFLKVFLLHAIQEEATDAIAITTLVRGDGSVLHKLPLGDWGHGVPPWLTWTRRGQRLRGGSFYDVRDRESDDDDQEDEDKDFTEDPTWEGRTTWSKYYSWPPKKHYTICRTFYCGFHRYLCHIEEGQNQPQNEIAHVRQVNIMMDEMNAHGTSFQCLVKKNCSLLWDRFLKPRLDSGTSGGMLKSYLHRLQGFAKFVKAQLFALRSLRGVTWSG